MLPLTLKLFSSANPQWSVWRQSDNCPISWKRLLLKCLPLLPIWVRESDARITVFCNLVQCRTEWLRSFYELDTDVTWISLGASRCARCGGCSGGAVLHAKGLSNPAKIGAEIIYADVCRFKILYFLQPSWQCRAVSERRLPSCI